jgi:protein O-mannosyl-transferase
MTFVAMPKVCRAGVSPVAGTHPLGGGESAAGRPHPAWWRDGRQLVCVGLILAAVLLSFSPALSPKKEFTNWDDPGYVTEQPLVQGLSLERLMAIFDPRTDVMLNFHPLTVLSLALNHQFSQLDVGSYALTNVLLHVLNTFLVFLFLYRLSGRRFRVAALAALWFGIHPMHVESVAWISGRKDLLYCFFFLASCIVYLDYLATRRLRYLVLAFVAFVLSCLSKAAAVPLPFVLLLLDYTLQRKSDPWMFLEKIPFLLVAAGLGWVAYLALARHGLADLQGFTLRQRFGFACYGFVMYWARLFVPYRLSAFYPYSTLGEHGSLPAIYLLMPPLGLLIIVLPLALTYGRSGTAFRIAAFGLGFFVLMLVLELQLVSISSAVMADRYTYVPYIGAFFLIASGADALLESKRLRAVTAVAVAVYSLALGVGSYRRTWVWTNSETLWSDAIEKHPFRIEEEGGVVRVLERGATIAYQNRGNYYRDHGQREAAVRDYEVLTKARVPEPGPYVNLGNVYGERGDDLVRQGRPGEADAEFAKALELYSRAIELGGDLFETHLDRGITYASMRQHERALEDFRIARRAKPDARGVLSNIAYEELQLGRYDECIADASALIEAEPDDAQAHFFRGTAFMNTGRAADAAADLRRAVALDPAFGAAWFNLSMLYRQAGDAVNALEAAQKARDGGYPVADGYLEQLKEAAR